MYKYNIIIWKKNCHTNNEIPISHERERERDLMKKKRALFYHLMVLVVES